MTATMPTATTGVVAARLEQKRRERRKRIAKRIFAPWLLFTGGSSHHSSSSAGKKHPKCKTAIPRNASAQPGGPQDARRNYIPATAVVPAGPGSSQGFVDWNSATPTTVYMALHKAILMRQEEAFTKELIRAAAAAKVPPQALYDITFETIRRNKPEILRALLASKVIDPSPYAEDVMKLAADKTRLYTMRLLLRDFRLRRALSSPMKAPVLARDAFESTNQQCCRVARFCLQVGTHLRKISKCEDDVVARILAMAFGKDLICGAYDLDYLMTSASTLMLDFFVKNRALPKSIVNAAKSQV
eukprot:CAMPEP_0171521140 /NCGR_PEP_ID=MMETSP0959-20130129/6949_1 /TAXON_ID=87120 /ORGANISM="Aurantiochytrium limacinum, Strain ATCCMYA-1381" /LENGTH=300 /DNA_ID=CAMNT_0012060973 /DNA_START=204 /DNA_END=1106 /DNA_ORIENTATION=-